MNLQFNLTSDNQQKSLFCNIQDIPIIECKKETVYFVKDYKIIPVFSNLWTVHFNWKLICTQMSQQDRLLA